MMKLPSLLYNDAPAHSTQIVENAALLAADLNLTRIFNAMAGGNPFIQQVARETLLARESLSCDAILYRQGILSDFLRNPAVCRALFDALSEGIELYETYLNKSLPSFSTFITASAVIKDRIVLFRMLFGCVRKVAGIMRESRGLFGSPGICRCFEAFLEFYGEGFLASAEEAMLELEAACANTYACLSAGIGLGLKGDRYTLHAIADEKNGRNGSHTRNGDIGLTSVGIQAQAGKLRDAALSELSYVIRQVNDATLADLKALRRGIAFYLGGVNLHGKLGAIGVPACFPVPQEFGGSYNFDGLVDIGLAIENSRLPVGNSFGFDSFRLLVVTGANQGGKSTFVRSVGCAELMMQCGLFVAAKHYSSGIFGGIHTHFCRPESRKADQGRLDEELARMNEIVGQIGKDSLVLMNESFSTTSEREASAIAEEVLGAFYDAGVRAVYVTHFYEYARIMEGKAMAGVHFLVAQRNADGSRPYTLAQAKPAHTSFGMDIYREVFGE